MDQLPTSFHRFIEADHEHRARHKIKGKSAKRVLTTITIGQQHQHARLCHCHQEYHQPDQLIQKGSSVEAKHCSYSIDGSEDTHMSAIGSTKMTMMKIIHIVIAVVETSKGQETFLSLSSCFIYHQEEVMVLTHPADYNGPNEEARIGVFWANTTNR